MNQQPLWRGAMSVVEQITGYYTVHVSERFEHGQEASSIVYPNLSWTEVEQLADDVVKQWDTTRRLAQSGPQTVNANQLRIFDLP